MTTKDFKLPDLGEGVHDGQVVRVMVTPGMVVQEDQPLMEVETDKAAVVIPCPFAGTVEKVHVRDGQMVHVGEVMVTIDLSSSDRSIPQGPATSVARGATSQSRSNDREHPATNTATLLAKPQAAAASTIR